ncbi:uncharacterized protein [Rutidosis leptorrhynchoides]|uniref:uncharacterized protein n=1 Tax=Rutidosis leptorrhynchoides TaxID=125765 RepID=UPI003A9A62C0
MSAEMATKVQSKTHFPGSMIDLNNGLYNGMWDPYHGERTERTTIYDPYFMRQTMNGYNNYPKEQMRQTILKQESIFRHQLQELHRLHKRQSDLMNEFTMKKHCNSTMPTNQPNLNQVSSWIAKEMHSQRRVIDLELPADVDENNKGKQPVETVHNLNTSRSFNLTDLNEPVQLEETSFAESIINNKSDQKSNSGLWYVQSESKKSFEHLPRKRTLFGVELFESNHTPSFDSARDQNTSMVNFNHNRWIGSSNGSRQIPEDFAGTKRANVNNSRFLTSGINSNVPVSDSLQEPRENDKKKNLENGLPPWLMKTKGKETTLYQMNMDSLQQNSQQFFSKSEKVQTDNSRGITKILGVPIISGPDNQDVSVNNKNKSVSQQIDLNISFDEEEEAPHSIKCIPEAVVKIASMQIDLEAPAAPEIEKDDNFIDANDELVQAAAEAIMSISVHEAQPADTLLVWFADAIASGEIVEKESVNVNNEECIPEGMDYFEFMTLNLKESREEYFEYKAAVQVVMEENEEDESLLRKRATRKGQGKRGRQRRDFQRDVLPGIVSLSRREVSEDIQIFEEAFSGIGVSWQSKRKAGGKNGRGRRRLAATSPQAPPMQPPAVAAEQTVCRQVALDEKSLSGWGKRTRRLPRQRCQNGGNHHSLALKC